MTQSKINTAANQPKGIVIRGLPGVGKTTLSNLVAEHLRDTGKAVAQINADFVRSTLNTDLDFSKESRAENARRIGAVTWLTQTNGIVPVVDFVMPTKQTYDNFIDGCGGHNFILYTILPKEGFVCRYPDTAKIFEIPQEFWVGGVYSVNDLVNLTSQTLSAEELACTIFDDYAQRTSKL